jgi:hypothetical protein
MVDYEGIIKNRVEWEIIIEDIRLECRLMKAIKEWIGDIND